MAESGDRRKRSRVPLHWTMRLFTQPGKPPAESVTENLSSEGLYCITKERFKPGQRLQCEIVIPATLGVESPVVIECHVTVRRVEPLHGGFGLGCHIEDYSLRPPLQV
jgi:PilZ domain